MTFEVIWLESAEQELAAIWMAIPPSVQQPVRDATNRLERLLTRDAHQNGQPCDGDYYIRVDPLMAFYSVDLAARRVEVIQIVLTP